MIKFQEDWLMRQIKMTVMAIAQIVFGKAEALYEIVDEARINDTDLLHKDLLALLDDLKINEAENLLFEKIDMNDLIYLLVAIDFYNRLNSLEDEALEKGDYSRGEIERGMATIKEIYEIAI